MTRATVPRPLRRLGRDGVPLLWLGANFWSRVGGPRMWRHYDAAIVREELATLAGHGIGMTRSFCYWPDFMPQPDRLDQAALEAYDDFLDAHAELGMTTVPTFLVGHMSGQNWDPAWRDGGDLYGDVWLVGRQAWFIRAVTQRYAAHPAVDGWLISNEMPLYGGPADQRSVTSWAELVVQAVRAGGGTQPVSLGDGAWGVEVTGRDNGFSLRATRDLVDFVGPHVYPMGDDQVRQHLRAALCCELAAVAERPVVLEEFGTSTDFVSEEKSAHYLRQVLHTSLLAGAGGWIVWNNTDFDDLADQDPYRHHPFEMHFGITDGRGRPKPALPELREFGRLLTRLGVAECDRAPTQTALLVPSYLEGTHPFTDPADASLCFDVLEQAHIAAREADLPPGFVRERDGITAGYRVYLVPSVKALEAPTWFRLQGLAEAGATVWVSYSAGASEVQRGPWWANTLPLLGVRNDLSYGLIDPIEDDEIVLRFVEPLGDLRRGDRLSFRGPGGHGEIAYLPVEVVDAEVLAVDGHGRPAILRKRHGDGQAVLSTYPLEQLAATLARVNPEPTWRIYRALAVEAGAAGPVSVPDPRVLVDGLVHRDGRRYCWLVSESDEEIEVVPRPADGVTLSGLDGAPAGARIRLPPYGVTVLEIGGPAALNEHPSQEEQTT